VDASSVAEILGGDNSYQSAIQELIEQRRDQD
jgi:hypothetical protein